MGEERQKGLVISLIGLAITVSATIFGMSTLFAGTTIILLGMMYFLNVLHKENGFKYILIVLVIAFFELSFHPFLENPGTIIVLLICYAVFLAIGIRALIGK